MVNLLITLALLANPTVEVQTLDGRTVSGALVAIDSSRATVETADGRRTVDVERLIGGDFAGKQGEEGAKPGVWVQLRDGSSLVGTDCTAAEDRCRVDTSHGPMELPWASVNAICFAAITPDVENQWERIAEAKASADRLVVRKENHLNYHQGIVRSIGRQTVEFDLDGDVLPVKREKVFGLVFYRPGEPPATQPLCRIAEAGGSRWVATSLQMRDGRLHWTTPAGAEVSRPVEKLRLDFAWYLSDLQPESVAWTPYFGQADQLPLLERFGLPRMDRSLDGGPLVLHGQEYAKGIAVRSRTEIVYRLPGRFRRFRATAGIDDAVRPHGHVRLVVRCDDRSPESFTLTGTDEPLPLDVDLTGVRRLSILVDFGDGADVGDHLDLCRARIVP